MQSNLEEVTKLQTVSFIQNLFKGCSSNCTVINNLNIRITEEITLGLLLINSYSGPLQTDKNQFERNILDKIRQLKRNNRTQKI